jgi:hypothetical protein
VGVRASGAVPRASLRHSLKTEPSARCSSTESGSLKSLTRNLDADSHRTAWDSGATRGKSLACWRSALSRAWQHLAFLARPLAGGPGRRLLLCGSTSRRASLPAGRHRARAPTRTIWSFWRRNGASRGERTGLGSLSAGKSGRSSVGICEQGQGSAARRQDARGVWHHCCGGMGRRPRAPSEDSGDDGLNEGWKG